MSGAPENILKAIFTYGNAASTFKTAMTGGVFYQHAWSSGGGSFNTFPYAVFFQVSDVPEYTYNTEMADLLFQWSIFDDDQTSGLTLLDAVSKLHTRFDEASFSITGWTLMRCQREGHILMSPDEQGIRHSATTYRVTASKD